MLTRSEVVFAILTIISELVVMGMFGWWAYEYWGVIGVFAYLAFCVFVASAVFPESYKVLGRKQKL